MTDKKPTTKRPVAMPRLYAAIETFMASHDLTMASPLEELLGDIKDEWFKAAQSK